MKKYIKVLLVPTFIMSMTNAEALSSQFDSLDITVLRSMPVNQMQTNQLGKVLPEQMKAFDYDGMDGLAPYRDFNPAQVGALTPAALAASSQYMMNTFPCGEITAEHVSQLSAQQISWIADDFQGLAAEAFRGFNKNAAGLTINHMGWLMAFRDVNPNVRRMVANFSPVAVSMISADTMASDAGQYVYKNLFSEAQRAARVASSTVVELDGSTLSVFDIRGLAVNNLTAAQVAAMTPAARAAL